MHDENHRFGRVLLHQLINLEAYEVDTTRRSITHVNEENKDTLWRRTALFRAEECSKHCNKRLLRSNLQERAQ